MNKRAAIYLACILLLEWFCFMNAYVVDLKGAAVDATKFHEAAIRWLQFGEFQFVVDSEFYAQFLGSVYYLFGTHEMVGAQISVIALITGAVYFEKILKLFHVSNSCYWVIPFLLWPSLITRATTVMREPLLICFTVIIVYHVLMFRRNEKPIHALSAIMASLFAALIHKAYAVLVIIVVPYILFVVVKQKDVFYRSGVFYMRVGLGLAFATMLILVFRDFGDVRGLKPVVALVSGDAEYLQAVVDSKSSKGARATYSATIDFSSLPAILATYPAVLLYYLFSPFPWRVGSVYDAYASVEGLLRLAAFFGFFVTYKKFRFDRKNLEVVFTILITLSLIWAAGTTNYGTASRHHTTTIWIFLLFIALVMRRIHQMNCDRTD